MKKILRTTLAAFALIGTIFSLAACGDGTEYTDSSDRSAGYDTELFFRNEGEVQAADPSVITVGDTFYLYATNAYSDGDCSYICAWKSKDLSHWEALGPVFTPARDAWAVTSLWAPEVIEKDGKYYMYYSGNELSSGTMKIGLATAASPEGPFHEIEGEYGGKTYSRTECPFDFGFPAIDPSPFIDEDGSIYLYISQDQVERKSSVYGCRLESDMVTVAEGTLTSEALVEPSQDWENPQKANTWNEAPFMVKHGGKYYLFYSANFFESSTYAVGVAVGDTPLGAFEKAAYNPILQAESDWDFISGPGHCSLFPSPDKTELWMAYHSHIDVTSGGGVRKINFDKLVFGADGKVFLNGPSTTAQPLPSGCGEYKNIAASAQIGDEYSVLTDGIINYSLADSSSCEVAFDKKTTLTLRFSEPRTVKGILIYDSADYKLSAKSADIKVGDVSYAGVKFSAENCYVDEYGYEIKIPGSGIAMSFAEIKVSEISVTLEAGVALSEIMILGK